jgi:nucleoid-associated protein YgaU
MGRVVALESAAGGALAMPGENGGAKSPSGRPKMERAVLKVYEATPAPGGARPGSPLTPVTFQFNPREVTIAKSAKWERKRAKDSPTAGPPEFTGSDPCKLTLEMFFDATSSQDGSVVVAVENLLCCCVPTEKSISDNKPVPPLVVLHWGAISSFPAFVTSVSAKYTLFSSNGTPLRAVCSVSLEEMPGSPPRQNPTSGSEAVRRAHRTVAGDTLASIAYAHYGDPTRWRPLAAYNGIDDPMRVDAGTTLLLPAIEELSR